MRQSGINKILMSAHSFLFYFFSILLNFNLEGLGYYSKLSKNITNKERIKSLTFAKLHIKCKSSSAAINCQYKNDLPITLLLTKKKIVYFSVDFLEASKVILKN